MKRSFLAIFAAALLFSIPAFAQRNIDPAIDRDPLLEADAKHNLDVAWQAFKPGRKAYKQVLLRFEETFAAYPDFSKMDEFLYLAGMSSYYLSKNEGKQKINLLTEKDKEKYAPEKLRQDAVAYFALMLERNPQSSYKDQVAKIQQELQASK